VVGVGNPDQKVPISVKGEGGETTFLRDSQGEIASSKLNEDLLAKIAVSSGGIYVRSTSVEPGLKEILPRIKALSQEKYSSGQNTRPVEKFQIPLAIAVIILLSRLAISERRKPMNLAIGILILLFPNFCPGAPEADENIKTYRPEKVQDLKTENSGKKDPRKMYNEGFDKHSKNELDSASQLYQNAAGSSLSDVETRKKSFQNLGAIEHSKGREIINSDPHKAMEFFKSAENMYRESMKEDFNSRDVSENQQILLKDMEKAKKAIEKQKEQQEKKDKARKELEKAAQENKEASNNPGNQKEKEQAKSQTEKAKDAMEQHMNQTPDEDKNEKDKTGKAKSEIKNAMDEQKKGDFDKAQEHLEKALKEFSKNEKNDKDEKQQEKQPEKRKSDEEQKKAGADKKPEEEKNIDPEQAASILDLMAQDENKLREELKNRVQENSKIKEVDKDW
nr:PTS lactose/cellobiose transporter subunit IIA [Victivallales bacterium]